MFGIGLSRQKSFGRRSLAKEAVKPSAATDAAEKKRSVKNHKIGETAQSS